MVVSKENKVYFMTEKNISVYHVLVIAVLFQGLEREEFVDCNDLPRFGHNLRNYSRTCGIGVSLCYYSY